MSYNQTTKCAFCGKEFIIPVKKQWTHKKVLRFKDRASKIYYCCSIRCFESFKKECEKIEYNRK